MNYVAVELKICEACGRNFCRAQAEVLCLSCVKQLPAEVGFSSGRSPSLPRGSDHAMREAAKDRTLAHIVSTTGYRNKLDRYQKRAANAKRMPRLTFAEQFPDAAAKLKQGTIQ